MRVTLLLELAAKVGYYVALIVNICGLANGSAALRHTALPLSGVCLAVLLLCWRKRVGWINKPFAWCVLAGLVFTIAADVVMSQPILDYLDYAGLTLHQAALLAFTAGFSFPSVPPARKSTALGPAADGASFFARLYGGVNSRRSAASRHAPAVPLHAPRAVAPLLAAVAALVIWRVCGGGGEATDPRYVAAACLFTLQALLVWRAAARVGYASPFVTVHGLLAVARKREAQAEEAASATAAAATREFGARALDGIAGSGGLRSTSTSKVAAALDDDDDDDGGGGGGGGGLGAFAWSDDGATGDYSTGGGGDSSSGSSSTVGSAYPAMSPRSSRLMVARASSAATAAMQEQRRQRNQRLYEAEAASLERRGLQWCGVGGVLCCCAALLLIAYDRLWLHDDDDPADGGAASASASALDATLRAGSSSGSSGGMPSSFTATAAVYLYTLLSWAGRTLLVYAVPCALPEQVQIDDPRIAPMPTDGQSLRVVILLPTNTNFDVTEVTAVWHYLHRRGHTVLFATNDGLPGLKWRRHLPLPYEPSVHGYVLRPGVALANCCAEERRGAGSASASGRGGCCGSRPRSGGSSCCGASGQPRNIDGRYHRSSSGSSRSGVAVAGGGCCRSCCGTSAGSGGSQRRGGGCCGAIARWFLRLCCCCGAGASGDGASGGCGVTIGHPGPLVVALYRQLLEDPSYRRPLAWSASALAATAQLLAGRKGGSSSLRRGGAGAAYDPLDGGAGHARGGDAGYHAFSEYQLLPDSFDGMVVCGAYPAGDHDEVWSDRELQALVSQFWITGRPMAFFGNAPLLLARCRDAGLAAGGGAAGGGDASVAGAAGGELSRAASGRPPAPLLYDNLVTAITGASELATGWLLGLTQCRWRVLQDVLQRRRDQQAAAAAAAAGGGSGGGKSTRLLSPSGLHRSRSSSRDAAAGAATGVVVDTQSEVERAMRVPARFVEGAPSPLLSLRALLEAFVRSDLRLARTPQPCDDAHTIVVEDGPLLTAQGGADAFTLVRRFTDKLEQAQRTF